MESSHPLTPNDLEIEMKQWDRAVAAERYFAAQCLKVWEENMSDGDDADVDHLVARLRADADPRIVEGAMRLAVRAVLDLSDQANMARRVHDTVGTIVCP